MLRMTINEVREEIVLVKQQIAASGGVSGKSIDGASVSFATSELYKRLQHLEDLERRMSVHRTVRSLDISQAFDPPEPEPMYRAMTNKEVDDLIDGVEIDNTINSIFE